MLLWLLLLMIGRVLEMPWFYFLILDLYAIRRFYKWVDKNKEGKT